MSLYGEEYKEEIDEIYRLALSHLRKHMENDPCGANDRVMGAVATAYASYFMNLERVQKKKKRVVK